MTDATAPVPKGGEAYFLAGPDARATGVLHPGGFLVRAGSLARAVEVPSTPDAVAATRQRLVADGVLTPQGDGRSLRLTKDHLFTSPSRAAAVMLGRSATGLGDWKDVEGHPLRDRSSGTTEERELRRRWYEAHAARLEADDAEMGARRTAQQGFEASAADALQLLGQLGRDGDVAAFATALQAWATRSGTLAFNGFSGQMFVNQLAKTAASHPELGQILASSLAAPTDPADAAAKIRALVSYVEAVKVGHHPAPGHTPFLLSYFWGLQDHAIWPVLWSSAAHFLEYLLGEALPLALPERYTTALEVIRGLDDSNFRFEHTASWWDETKPVFVDEVLADRCAFGREATASPEALDRNSAALGSTANYLADQLAEAVSAASGHKLTASRRSGKGAGDVKPAATLSAAWTAAGHGDLGIRLLVNSGGMAIGLRSGSGSTAPQAEVLELLRREAPAGYQLIDASAPASQPVQDTGHDVTDPMLARWFSAHDLGTVEVHGTVVATAAALQPALDHLLQLDDGSAAPATSAGSWEEFLTWAERFHEHPDFDEWERTYKVEAADRLAELRADTATGEADLLETVSAEVNSKQNLTGWRLGAEWKTWVGDDPGAALAGLRALWDSADATSGMRQFDALARNSTLHQPGMRLNLGSFLLMARGWPSHPPMRIESFRTAWKLSAWHAEPVTTNAADVYAFALDYLDALLEASKPWGYPLRDRLDAQGVVWTVAWFAKDDAEAPSGWSQHDWSAFRRFVGASTGARAARAVGGEATDDEDLDPLEAAARDLLIEPAFVADIADRLDIHDPDAKKQVIFYGPPGTGKTFLARRLTKALAPGDTEHLTVQFHPSTSYEDFFEGYRPSVTNGQMTYSLVEGPLRRLAEAARRKPERRHVLLIDEINRANVAKVLGELLYLFEYRDEPIRTLYRPDDDFTLPPNLCFLATMNTADRSIALVDAALRRRFDFIPFFPSRPPIEGLLERWLDANGESAWVGGLVAMANQELAELLGPDFQLGPSYFMKPGLDEATVRKIWSANIEPLIEDQFFGHADQIAKFSFDKVQRRYQESSGSADLAEAELAEAATAESGTATTVDPDDEPDLLGSNGAPQTQGPPANESSREGEPPEGSA